MSAGQFVRFFSERSAGSFVLRVLVRSNEKWSAQGELAGKRTNMKRSAAFLAIALLSTAKSSVSQPKLNVDAPPDTFIAGCELILSGKSVPFWIDSGRRGYRIQKTSRTLTVNGMTVFSGDMPSRKIVVSQDMERVGSVISSAAAMVRESRDKQSGALTAGSVQHHTGDTFSLEVPSHNATVEVTLGAAGAFSVTFEGHEMIYGAVKAPATQGDAIAPVDAAFYDLLRHLRAGRLVVKGVGYTYFFPLSNASAVRASLAKIKGVAELESSNEAEVRYKAVRIDGYLWDSGVVRDFLESGDK